MRTEKKNRIENFLSNLDTPITVLDFVDIEHINTPFAFDDIFEQIAINGGFDIEIIYYSDAMNYLSDNDPSLRESLKLASEMGLSLDSLDSETLASLLASQTERDDFCNLADEINDFFEELNEEEEEEE